MLIPAKYLAPNPAIVVASSRPLASFHGTDDVQEPTVVAAASESSNRNRTTAMSGMRTLRSFCRQRLTTVWTCGGTSRGNAFQSGSAFTTEAMISVTSSPSNARLPVSIS